MATKKTASQKHLKAVLKNYPLGLQDWHLPVFRKTFEYCGHPQNVLYPGCHRHITPSLVFPSVTYVDFDAKVGPVYSDPVVLEWLRDNCDKNRISKKKEDENKKKKEKAVDVPKFQPSVEFQCCNFQTQKLKVKPDSDKSAGGFDLLISACAGIISTHCHQYLKPGGYLLVSDAHFDARTAYVHPKVFELVGVFDEKAGALATDKEDLKGHFSTKKEGKPITQAQVEESIKQPRSKWSFKLEKSAMFYLFRKRQEEDTQKKAAPSLSVSHSKAKPVGRSSSSRSDGQKQGKRNRDD